MQNEETVVGPASAVQRGATKSEGRHLTLTVVEGRDVGLVFALQKGRTTIGRASTSRERGTRNDQADIALRDKRASRRHAVLIVRATEQDTLSATVLDIGGRNGTFVGGEALSEEEHVLRDKDLLRVGDTTLRFATHDTIDVTDGARRMSFLLRDPSTQLYLRAYAVEELRKLLAPGPSEETPAAVLLGTIAAKGDSAASEESLVAVARVVLGELSDGDVAARYDSTRVLIVLPETSEGGAVQVAERLRKAVQTAAKCDLAIGIATFPGHGGSADALLGQAEAALDMAKKRSGIDVAPGVLPPKLAHLLSLVRAAEREVVLFTAVRGLAILRVSLAVVFFWFGALKVLGLSPVEDLVARTVFWIPKPWALQVLGWTEMLVGAALFFRRAMRLALAMFFVHMPGTFLVLVLHPELSFEHGNPLRLTTIGEFVLKNIVLVAAGLMIVGTLRRRDERIWVRRSD